jgi:signal transduction histidine kinase/DNA-binding response OmpR family regulator
MILIVDDRPENIFALKSILELNSFSVDTADSGEEALRKILKTSYSLIILDVQMPQMDGFELAEMILGFSKTKDTPIIFLSAISKEKKFITKGFKSGGIDYITKPVDPDILLLKVKSMYTLSEQRLELKRTQEKLLQEIETRKEAEAALAARMDELRTVMETLPQIAFTVSKAGDIEYVNSEWYLFSEKQGVFPEHHPEDGPVCDEWAFNFSHGIEFVRELRIRKLTDQAYRHYLLRIIPVKQGDEILRWVGAFSDIHQQKLANEILEQRVEERTLALLEKNRELESSNSELQQFAWVISHDLKEPVRKMMTFTNLIREKHLKDNEPALADFGRIIKSAERMSILIGDLLDFSQVSITARFEEISLENIVSDVLSDYEIQVEQTGAVITKGALPVIEAVPSQMRQVFQNLISNSLKFTQEGITPHIDISADFVETLDAEAPAVPSGPYCRIRVTDNGIGFEEKYLDKIFLVFQRLSHSNVYDGTGIGLAIAKKSIEKHNGMITAKSAPGKGTTFLILLPVRQTVIQVFNS